MTPKEHDLKNGCSRPVTGTEEQKADDQLRTIMMKVRKSEMMTKVAGGVVGWRSLGGGGVSLPTQCSSRTAAGGGRPRGEPGLGPPLYQL